MTKQNVEKYFEEVEKFTPQYHQSMVKLQQDYLASWKNVINSAITLEKEYAQKAGLKIDVPETTLKTVRDITTEAIKTYVAQNRMAANTSEATKQAFKVFNENTKSFASLNRNIMGFMMSVLEQKQRS